MSDIIIEFIKDSLLKRPKKLHNNVFILYSPNGIKLRPGEFINVYKKLSVCMAKQIILSCVFLPTLSKNGLRMESFHYISADSNICNASQPWEVHFELVNRSANTVFSIRKTEELCFLTALTFFKNTNCKFTNLQIVQIVNYCSNILCIHLLIFFLLSSHLVLCSFICHLNFRTNCHLFKKTIVHSLAAFSKSKNVIILQRGQ